MNSEMVVKHIERHTLEEISEKVMEHSRLSVPLFRQTSLGSAASRLETALNLRQRADEHVDIELVAIHLFLALLLYGFITRVLIQVHWENADS